MRTYTPEERRQAVAHASLIGDEAAGRELGIPRRTVSSLRSSPKFVAIVRALLSIDPPPTYRQLADELGIHVGTVHTHLRRLRDGQPEFYREVMAERRRQLSVYHAEVVERRRSRSLQWGRRRFAARYRAEHGMWPWDVYRRRDTESCG